MLMYMSFKDLFRIYWFASLATIIILTIVGVRLGPEALFLALALTLLEATFSADNAVVNSKVLITMSPAWQKAFMTIGIFTAVFVVRFILPIVIISATAHLPFSTVVDLAFNDPVVYGEHLEESIPVINAFGGTFLIMIALSYFIDYEKKTHWIKSLEKYLGKLGQFDNITVFLMLLASIGIYFTVDEAHRATMLIASICAMTLHISLSLLSAAMSKKKKLSLSKQKTGLAALSAFLYLEVLDASFSLDGVIGAFALTNNAIIILAGLSAGAVWVRAMTIHLVRAKVLSKYTFLEHGAHWAIGFLGAIMLIKLYHIEPPEWFVGGLGLVFIAAAILWSKRAQIDAK